ncbi:N-acetylmuramoyl-L-alanine amidase [Erwinia sp. AnSW2-5]|uniref:N-acetylmuramoyl-L-alanine amidase n=1 Tax=Erwinia sp. AnSW2-5 TaxID=3367692 RepID=UPI00385CE62E
MKKTALLENAWRTKEISDREKAKTWPDRFPANTDSIGIEIVGAAYKKDPSDKNAKEYIYEAVTEQQNQSLKWLINELKDTFGIRVNEIFRHPDIARKNETEASSAKW